MIVEQQYWDNAYEKYSFQELPNDDPTKYLIDSLIPDAQTGETAFEIGCYPGRFLLEIGRKGYILNGCDKTERVTTHLGRWLIEKNCKVGALVKADFRDSPKKKYNVVASFGFIEHFTDFAEVFNYQCSFLENDGLLVVQFPNFSGIIQRCLHYFLDRDNLRNHVLGAMNPKIYRKLLGDEYEVIFCGHYGNFDFWIDDYKKRNGKLKTFLLSLFFKSKFFWDSIPNSSMWSPYAALVARKVR